MTRRKKLISIFIALIIIVGVLSVLLITASAANVTVGNSLFTNTKNITIKGTDDGLALRVDQEEFSSADYATTLPMNNFAIDFKIIDDNFDTLIFTFTSMYDENISNNYSIYNNTATEKQKRLIIQPEKIKNTITLKKDSNGKLIIKFNNENVETNTGLNFVGTPFQISYNVKSGDDTKGEFSFVSGNYSKKSTDVERIINDEANLNIEFNGITKVRKDTKNDKDETVEGASTLLINKMSYDYNDASVERQEQLFNSASVADTSKPIVKADKKLLTSNNIKVPVSRQYKIPVYGIDIIKSLSSLSFDATVKYYSAADAQGVDVEVSNMAFIIEKSTGYYAIEKISVRDGNNTVDFENKAGSINNIGGIALPIIVNGVERTDSSDASKSFKFNISSSYVDLFDGLELKGGSENKIVFPMPIIGNADYVADKTTGVRAYVGNELESNIYNITYQIWYQHESDYADSWTKYSKTGLEFTATKEGTYRFLLEAYDRQGHNDRCATPISLTFKDSEAPKISVNNFPDKKIVNEKFTIPTASTSDDFDSAPTKTIKLYYLKDDGTLGDQIELAASNSFTPTELGKYVVVYNATDAAGFKASEIKRVFEVVEADEVPNVPFFKFDTLSIIFLCIGGAALIGIIVLLFWKPKEKTE